MPRIPRSDSKSKFFTQWFKESLIRTNSINDMTKFFRCINTSYAKYFNSKCHKVGYVFSNRYKSEAIYTVNQLFNTINYIHRNPIKSKICSEATNYKYSSYNEYFNMQKIIDKKLLKKYFKSNSIFKIE